MTRRCFTPEDFDNMLSHALRGYAPEPLNREIQEIVWTIRRHFSILPSAPSPKGLSTELLVPLLFDSRIKSLMYYLVLRVCPRLCIQPIIGVSEMHKVEALVYSSWRGTYDIILVDNDEGLGYWEFIARDA
jgi:hypothetical protein